MKKYIYVVLLSALVMSCSLDGNQDPNEVRAESAIPSLRLSAASTTAYTALAKDMNGLGNYWMNSWAGNNAYYGGPTTREDNLELTTSFYQGIWQDSYKAITRFQQIIDHEAAEESPNYVAIAKIQKAFYMQYIVDLYGDAPYSEAFQETENVTPAYDKDVEIYKGLVQELKEALSLIDQFGDDEVYAVEGSSDPVFTGNMDKWKRFANSVLLKFAVRLSNTSDSEGQSLKNDIVSTLSGASFITEDVTINPGYNNESESGQNPLYNEWGWQTFTGTRSRGRIAVGSDHLIKSLEGEDSKITSGISDARIGFLLKKAEKYTGTSEFGPEGYYGYVQGHTNDGFQRENGFDPFDDNIVKPAEGNLSFKGGDLGKESAEGALMDGVLMMLSESEFLQAEAAARGYAGFSGGQGYFEAGILASFEFDGLADEAAAYIAAISSRSQVGWTGSDEDKIAAIQYQRWVALTNYNGMENFINYLRTGYPETPLATTTTRPNKPWRLLYPAHEYTSNRANVPDVSLDQVFSKNETTPFIYR